VSVVVFSFAEFFILLLPKNYNDAFEFGKIVCKILPGLFFSGQHVVQLVQHVT